MSLCSLPYTGGIPRSFLAAALLVPAMACESSPPTAPSPTPATYQISGRVTDESGAPLAGVFVGVEYGHGIGGYSNPPAKCSSYCWLNTRTDAKGEYQVEFNAGPHPSGPSRIGFSYAIHEGYEKSVEIVPAGPAAIIHDFQLRRVRAIAAGEPVSFSVGPDSSRCFDSDMFFVWDSRCESFDIIATKPGTLVVDARGGSGGIVPEFYYWTVWGEALGPRVLPEPGIWTLPVAAGTYHVMVSIPDGPAPQRFDIITSLR